MNTGAITPDPVTAGEFNQRLVALCIGSGLSGLPRRRRDRHILLKSVALTLDRTREYSEEEVNQKLLSWLRDIGASIRIDHVVLRRHMVDEEYLGRSRGGGRYWVAVYSREQLAYAPEIEEIDVYALMRQGRDSIERRKREHLRRRGSPE